MVENGRSLVGHNGQLFSSEKKFSMHLTVTDLPARDTDENLLRRFFKAGVTPDFAENPKEAEVLEGQFEVCHI